MPIGNINVKQQLGRVLPFATKAENKIMNFMLHSPS
jgi:hypothetical protein